MNLVPILPVKNTLPLNAYALDFFKHGSSTVIEKENGLENNKVFLPNVLEKVSPHAVNKHQSLSIWTVLFLLVNLILKFPHVKFLDYKKMSILFKVLSSC